MLINIWEIWFIKWAMFMTQHNITVQELHKKQGNKPKLKYLGQVAFSFAHHHCSINAAHKMVAKYDHSK